jgi:predicted phage terminase large subunit-like protein
MRAGRGLEKLARRYSTAARGAERAGAYPRLLSWGRHYLPEHFRLPSSAMHRWLETQLDEVAAARGGRVNLIGPRGHAKSTVATLAYVLKSAVEAREPYIWIVSDTREQAQLHLENVKRELVDNVRLAADYPLACGPLAVGRQRRWQRQAIELASGVVIEAWSTGQRIRGRRRREHRPTLIVCDDLQNDSHIASAAQREATRRWFHGTLLKAGTKETNVVNLATALHRDALAMELLTTAGWQSARFAAIEAWPTNVELWDEWEAIYCGFGNADCGLEGTAANPQSEIRTPQSNEAARAFFDAHRAEMEAGAVVLWPEVDDLYTLMKMRVESGRTAFEREKQGSPVDPELCEWPEEYFEEHIWFESWEEAERGNCGFGIADCGLKGTAHNPQSEFRNPKSSLLIKAIALDPSKGGDGRRGDYSAFVLLGIDAAGVLFVEADLARRATPQMVADGAALCRRFRPHIFGVEANQFQELLAGELAAEFERQQLAHVVPVGVRNHINKQVRIRRLGPYLSQRRLRFLAGSASTRLLVEQLRDFPAGAHDDGPDALEMALRLAEEILHGRNADDGLGDRLIRP